MNRGIAFLVLSVWCLALGAPVFAEVPHLIRYQGQAVDSNGVPLEGPYTLTFRLYDAETAGTAVWQEVQSNVALAGGHFSVLLGQVQNLDDVDWTQPRWLSVQVNTEPELAPRQRITSVPLAIVAERLADSQSILPSGAIILWTGSACPAGYTRVSTYDDRFLVSAATAGVTGGSNTHDHGGSAGGHALTISEIPPHTHGLRGHANAGGPGPNWFPNLSDPVFTNTESAGGGAPHSHTIAPADSRPAFKTILLCQRN